MMLYFVYIQSFPFTPVSIYFPPFGYFRPYLDFSPFGFSDENSGFEVTALKPQQKM